MARKPIELIIRVVVQASVTFSLFYLFRRYDLPVMVITSLLGFIFILVIAIPKYNAMTLSKKIGVFGLALSFLILSILFSIKHYVTDIRITQLHIGGLILAPLLIMQYLDKREKKD